jgi:3-oxoacyl-[acyl-carrier-protein] synthase II
MKLGSAASVILVLLGHDALGFTTVCKNDGRSTESATKLHMSAVKPRVVVTGLGVISGCGIGHDQFFEACINGESSLDTVKRFDATNYPCSIASEVPDAMFNANDFFTNPKNVKSNDRYTHFAVAAARQALKDAGVGDTPETLENPEKIGVMVGSAFGGVETFERETLKLASKPDRPKVSLPSFFCTNSADGCFSKFQKVSI